LKERRVRWIVGDVHGCAKELETLLETIRFDPARDELWCVGDLINGGPHSLAAIRLWRSVGGRGLIGNHEIVALLARSGRRPKSFPLLGELFAAPDADDLMEALRALPVLVYLPAAGRGPDAWLVHAGLSPRWKRLDATAARLNDGPHDDDWLEHPDVRFAAEVRCCTEDGRCSTFTGRPDGCPAPFRPWDELYRGPTLVVHGHWAARGHYRSRHTMGLDSGCVHGGRLTAWCQDEDRLVHVPRGGSA
jgi:bis(5'-nucleosyl)-tetraphosphatase (symmetrical)